MRYQGLGPSPSPGVRDMGARGLTPLGQRFCVRQNRFERRSGSYRRTSARECSNQNFVRRINVYGNEVERKLLK